MSEGAATDVSPSRRHIIKRPRLTRLLDQTKARCILLVAPAGYGKTTLAHEWLDGPRRGAWFRGTSGAVDASAVALGLADATASIVEGSGTRLRERLRATQVSRADRDEVARLLADDLIPWPRHAWLVLDDYERLIGHRNSEELIAHLFNSTNVQLLITSRFRPSWVSARDILYGQVSELGQATLSMTPAESVLVLGTERPALLELTAGWPAVLGLAAHSGSSAVEEAAAADSPLYEYFAAELYRAADADLQRDLERLAVVPGLTSEICTHLLGAERSRVVIKKGESLGFFATDGTRIHPLLRDFLIAKLTERGRRVVDETALSVGRVLIQDRRWDDVFDVGVAFSADVLITELLTAALSDLLETGRSATLTEWVRYATGRGLTTPALRLAQAHIALRRGALEEAKMLGLSAARAPEHASQALATAGRAAHLSLNEWEAFELHSRAEACATTESEVREAIWGQFLCASELELPEAPDILKRFESRVSDIRGGRVQLAAGKLTIAVQRGGVDHAIAQAASMRRLMEQGGDPMARTSFLNSYADALVVGARYEAAIEVAQAAISEMSDYGLDFAMPYAELIFAAAECGLRQTAAATARAVRVAARYGELDSYLLVTARMIRARASLIAGDADAALSLLGEADEGCTSRSLTGQLLATRALVFAALNRSREALEIGQRARATTTGLEAQTLAAWACIAAGASEQHNVSDLTHHALHSSLVRGDRSSFVTAYRAIPRLLELAAAVRHYEEPLRSLLSKLDERDLARAHGIELPASPVNPKHADLSRREAEVGRLLLQGMTNRQIANTLFISEVTVKAHLRHIYAKLSVRSRTAAVLSLLRQEGPPERQRPTKD
jgi:LuxR family maltose regulon positive regulatory protein